MEHEDQTEEGLWQQLPTSFGPDRAEILMELARFAIQRSQGSEALALTQEAYDIYRTAGATVGSSSIANALTGMSYVLKEINQIDEAIKTITNAIEIYQEAGNPLYLDSMRTKAAWLNQSNQTDQTIATLLEIIQINELEGDFESAGRDHYNIGFCYLSQRNWLESIKHLEQARKIFANAKSYDEASWCDAQLAQAYVQIGNAEIARDLAQRSLAFGELRNANSLKCMNLYTLGIAETVLENFEAAEKQLLAAKEICADSTDWTMIERVERELLNLYTVTGKNSLAAKAEQNLLALQETAAPANTNN